MSNKEIEKLISKEKEILIIKKKSEYNFLESLFLSDSSILGFLYFIKRKKNDYLIITEKRVLYITKNKSIKNVEYNDFSKIQFNSFNDKITITDKNNDYIYFYLNNFRLSYDEIQKIKKLLN